MYNKKKVFLILILILAFGLRFYGINWDQDRHLHPDERMITMVTEGIRLPKPLTLNSLLTPQSPLNPKFFAYGSLPIYLLKITGRLLSFFNPIFAHYQGLNLAGRFLSVLFDLGTIILIFKIARKLFHGSMVPWLPCLFYTLSVLAIQTAHFYVVDGPLTFFITLTLYLLIKLASKPSLKFAILTGICFGLALASKVSAILLIVPILVALLIIFLRKRNLLSVFCYLFFVICFGFLVFSFTMPYALIDFQTFKANTLEQSRMTKDAFTFPYTLQYVNTTPYLYQIKNMVLWGMGVPLGVISVLGSLFVTFSVLKRLHQWLYGYMVIWLKKRKNYKSFAASLRPTPGESKPTPGEELRLTIQPFSHLAILLSFFWPYFLVTGSFAVKFMRYWLPIYPLFCIFGGLLISQIATFLRSQRTKSQPKTQLLPKFYLLSVICFLLSLFLWPLAFISIYSRPHSRITASEWINENIPQNSLLAAEHWDDHVPMWGEYQFLEMPMYEPDNSDQKWEIVNSNLEKADYIIIASNRLYVPLMKLTDCQELPPHRCFPKTTEYYQKLFNGQLGFTKVAEFTSYPTLTLPLITQLLNYSITIRDDVADESFTVYDHPKIMIFKKNPVLPTWSKPGID